MPPASERPSFVRLRLFPGTGGPRLAHPSLLIGHSAAPTFHFCEWRWCERGSARPSEPLPSALWTEPEWTAGPHGHPGSTSEDGPPCFPQRLRGPRPRCSPGLGRGRPPRAQPWNLSHSPQRQLRAALCCRTSGAAWAAGCGVRRCSQRDTMVTRGCEHAADLRRVNEGVVTLLLREATRKEGVLGPAGLGWSLCPAGRRGAGPGCGWGHRRLRCPLVAGPAELCSWRWHRREALRFPNPSPQPRRATLLSRASRLLGHGPVLRDHLPCGGCVRKGLRQPTPALRGPGQGPGAPPPRGSPRL